MTEWKNLSCLLPHARTSLQAQVHDKSGALALCLANCNFVIHRACNNVTSARCMLLILEALLNSGEAHAPLIAQAPH